MVRFRGASDVFGALRNSVFQHHNGSIQSMLGADDDGDLVTFQHLDGPIQIGCVSSIVTVISFQHLNGSI